MKSIEENCEYGTLWCIKKCICPCQIRAFFSRSSSLESLLEDGPLRKYHFRFKVVNKRRREDWLWRLFTMECGRSIESLRSSFPVWGLARDDAHSRNLMNGFPSLLAHAVISSARFEIAQRRKVQEGVHTDSSSDFVVAIHWLFSSHAFCRAPFYRFILKSSRVTWPTRANVRIVMNFLPCLSHESLDRLLSITYVPCGGSSDLFLKISMHRLSCGQKNSSGLFRSDEDSSRIRDGASSSLAFV